MSKNLIFEFKLACQLLLTKKVFLENSSFFSLLGLTLGVASLIVAMSVVSGYEVTLGKTMSDVTGHVIVVKKNRLQDPPGEMEEKFKSLDAKVTAVVPFLRAEALIAHQQMVRGILIQGLAQESRDQVLHLENRLIEGSLVSPLSEYPPLWIGKGIARDLKIHINDRIKLIAPIADRFDPQKFSRKVQEFQVRGVLELGKHEWNERLVLTHLKDLQELILVGDRSVGYMLRYDSAEYARENSTKLATQLGLQYAVTNWHELNENLFEAVRLERVIIFFVIFVIVLVAAFNIASSLFINVLRRSSEIALMRSLGLKRGSVLRIYGFQGLIYGLLGCLMGLILGFLLSQLLTWMLTHWHLMSADVYKIDGIKTNLRLVDILAVTLSTCLVCFFASLAPARRASRQNIVEGLRS